MFIYNFNKSNEISSINLQEKINLKEKDSLKKVGSVSCYIIGYCHRDSHQRRSFLRLDVKKKDFCMHLMKIC